MTRPALTAGIKNADDLSGFGIDPGQIGAFVFVIVMVRQSKVFRIIVTTVLLRDNMFNVQAVEWLVVLMNPAIFTSSDSPASDECTR